MSRFFIIQTKITACSDCPFFHAWLHTCNHSSLIRIGGKEIESDLDLDEEIPDWCPEVNKYA